MEELTRTGEKGIYVKVTPQLQAACRRYNIDVSRVAREALAAEVLRAAGREVLEQEMRAKSNFLNGTQSRAAWGCSPKGIDTRSSSR
jgi:post-segregation antitoxin (ccd killing protein)